MPAAFKTVSRSAGTSPADVRDNADVVVFACGSARLARNEIRAFAALLEREVAGGREFGCLISRDDELRRLNHDFLGKDCPTDVLSFPSAVSASGFLGDIAISLDRARQQSSDQGHTIEDEIRILMLHGVLHLLGMDHETDRGCMARTERQWRRRLGLPEGLIERTRP